MRGTLAWRKRYLSYGWLVPAAVLLGLAPFRPEPHLLEKIRMLAEGTLSKPIDIFDLALHGSPVALLVMRVGGDVVERLRGGGTPGGGA